MKLLMFVVAFLFALAVISALMLAVYFFLIIGCHKKSSAQNKSYPSGKVFPNDKQIFRLKPANIAAMSPADIDYLLTYIWQKTGTAKNRAKWFNLYSRVENAWLGWVF